MNYKPTKKDDLDDWKIMLSAEDIIKLDSDLEDYAWYSVVDDNRVIAIFQIINVIDIYSKNLDIKFAPNTINKHEYIVKIIIFIYESILKICKGEKINKVKIHTHDRLMEFIFQELSNTYQRENKVKNIKKYGKWVEIDL